MDEPEQAPTILVVDDDALQRMHASDLLLGAGYKVVEAENAEAALNILRDQPEVRLLFTDVQMPPGCDGLELAQQVHQRWPNVRLLITSGGVNVTDPDIPDRGRFVPKPYGDREVLGHVEGLITAKPATEG